MIKVSGYDYDFVLKIEDIYEILGKIDIDELEFIGDKLLVDKACQGYEINSLRTILDIEIFMCLMFGIKKA